MVDSSCSRERCVLSLNQDMSIDSREVYVSAKCQPEIEVFLSWQVPGTRPTAATLPHALSPVFACRVLSSPAPLVLLNEAFFEYCNAYRTLRREEERWKLIFEYVVVRDRAEHHGVFNPPFSAVDNSSLILGERELRGIYIYSFKHCFPPSR